MSNLRYSISALEQIAQSTFSPPPSIKISPPSTPNVESAADTLTTLRAHQVMLTNLYVAQNDAYTSAYTDFVNQCVVGDMVHAEIKQIVFKLLKQQKEIMLFQTFLWNFRDLVVGLENETIIRRSNGYAARKAGIGGGYEQGLMLAR